MAFPSSFFILSHVVFVIVVLVFVCSVFPVLLTLIRSCSLVSSLA